MFQNRCAIYSYKREYMAKQYFETKMKLLARLQNIASGLLQKFPPSLFLFAAHDIYEASSCVHAQNREDMNFLM